MRWGLVGVRSVIVLANVIIALIIILSIIPVVSGGLSISLPQSGVPRSTYEDGAYTLYIPVDVRNDGYFDVEDLRVHLHITDHGAPIIDHYSEPQDIVAGRTTSLNISMVLPLSLLSAEEVRTLAFNHTTLDVQAGISATYSLGLINAEIRVKQSMDWDPLITDIQVDTGAASASLNGTRIDVGVPYRFQASSLIEGRTITMHGELVNGTRTLSETSKTMVLDRNNNGSMAFVLGPLDALWLATHPADLLIVMDLTMEGTTAQLTYPYHWEGIV
jgi:hypothetical protein